MNTNNNFSAQPDSTGTLLTNTQYIPVEMLFIDEKYQRTINNAQVERIIKNFNPRQFGLLKVSFRDGRYYVIDGQHRLTAARQLGYRTLNCIVEHGLTRQDEADEFRIQQDNMRRVHTRDRFKAAVTADDEESIKIAEIVRNHGFGIQGFGIDCGSADCINAVAALQRVVRTYSDGFALLDMTLWLIRRTWGGQSKAAQGFVITGTSLFIRRFLEDGFDDDMFVKQLGDALTTVIANYNAEKYDHHIKSENRLDKVFSNLLAKQYNKGFSSRNKKRLVWED